MPSKVVETEFPLIDSDPHAARVISYFRPSDYALWAGATAAFPTVLYLWDQADPSKVKLKVPMRMCGFLGFTAGFFLAYQSSSLRFWGWKENAREQERDLKELTQRAREGKPLYGESDQPEWVQSAAHGNSQWSQLKFAAFPMFNLVHHKFHGTDPAKYGVKPEEAEPSS